jgi:uncharacterized membrane protein
MTQSTPIKSDYWQARAVLVLAIGLQLSLQRDMQARLGWMDHWVLPAAEVILLIALTGFKAFEHGRAASHPSPAERYLERHGRVRVLAVALIALITLANMVSLGRLIEALLHAAKASGVTLLSDAANLWITNVICFGLWHWELDRGGPAVRGTMRERRPDILFANMTAPDFCKNTWRPGFIDYLFFSFTNATAFSPTDALPLTRRAKLFMMAQAAISLLTIALVAARAVNILA